MEFLTITLIFITIITFTLISKSRARKTSKLPPGPYPLPIIGNIHLLGSKPHLSITKLSKKYGPIMTLKLGSLTTIVVSSPETHKLVLQKNDLAFSSRNIPNAVTTFNHDKFSMVYLPANNQWRKLRKICKEQMFSVSKLDASQGLRKEKIQKLYDHVNECSKMGRVVDIGEAAFTMSLNLISATLFSKEFAQFDSGSSHELKELVGNLMEIVGRPNFADFIPILKFFDPQGISRDAKIYFEKFFAIFDEIIDEKLRNGNKTNDLLETLIEINQRDETEFSRNDIRHLLLDLILAGTDTTTGTVEWAMTELIRNPSIMSRVRSEIIEVVGTNGQTQELDIPKLPYLQAVVKETLRLHPVGPFLIPHKAEADIEIYNYVVPKNAQIFINMWASGRDSSIWSNADSFMPERFLDYGGREIDFRGKDFEFIPFGAGRRMCPGLPLAYRMVHLTMATLIHKFNWKLEEGLKPEDMDMTEKFGLTLEKAVPLKAIPIKV